MEIILGLLCLYLGLIASGLFWSLKRDPFLRSDAERCLNRFCELDPNTLAEYTSRGYLCTTGLAVILDKGKKKFIKQAKIVW